MYSNHRHQEQLAESNGAMLYILQPLELDACFKIIYFAQKPILFLIKVLKCSYNFLCQFPCMNQMDLAIQIFPLDIF